MDKPTPLTAALAGVIKTFSAQHQFGGVPPMSDTLTSNCPCVAKLSGLENVFVIVLLTAPAASRITASVSGRLMSPNKSCPNDTESRKK